LEFGGVLGVLRKALDESQILIEFIKSQFSELRLWKRLIFEWILLLEIQTNCQNWVWKGKKIS
jgi:hypothetical protein